MIRRVLVVDDSVFVRSILSDFLREAPDLELVGLAKNGEEAIELAKERKPDLITLDVEMPVLDGISALRRILRECPTRVLMLSTLTSEGAAQTLEALEIGAVDFLEKPGGAHGLHLADHREAVLEKMRVASHARLVEPLRRPSARAERWRGESEHIVVVASSTGGPKALAVLLSGLPKGFPAPIVMVQHLPATFTKSLAARLSELGPGPCQEVAHDEPIEPGRSYLARGGTHLQIGACGRLEVTDDPPLHGVRPAADMLFLTAAKTYGHRVLGVVLTGMGRDGAKGAQAIRKAGGVVLGQSEESCVIYGMPKAAREAGGVDRELPLEDLPEAIVAICAKEVRLAS